MKRTSGRYALSLTAVACGFAAAGAGGLPGAQVPPQFQRPLTPYHRSGHGSPERGVHRLSKYARGSCLQCHSTKGQAGSLPKGLFARNDQTLCYACHQAPGAKYPAQEAARNEAGYFVGGRWPGAKAYEELRYSAHRASSNFVYPGTKHPAGDCKNCHDPHGTKQADMLVARYAGAGPAAANFQLCFDCHGEAKGPSGISRAGRRILAYYAQPLTREAAPGHQITVSARQRNDFTRAKLKLGDKLSCSDCHNVHGSQGSDGLRPNAKLISDQRAGFWYGLTNTLGDPVQNRRFCFGCHVEADGVAFSREVEGIKMNRLPDLGEHRAAGTKSCYACHASAKPYETDTSFNVHYVKFAP